MRFNLMTSWIHCRNADKYDMAQDDNAGSKCLAKYWDWESNLGWDCSWILAQTLSNDLKICSSICSVCAVTVVLCFLYKVLKRWCSYKTWEGHTGYSCCSYLQSKNTGVSSSKDYTGTWTAQNPSSKQKYATTIETVWSFRRSPSRQGSR